MLSVANFPYLHIALNKRLQLVENKKSTLSGQQMLHILPKHGSNVTQKGEILTHAFIVNSQGNLAVTEK